VRPGNRIAQYGMGRNYIVLHRVSEPWVGASSPGRHNMTNCVTHTRKRKWLEGGAGAGSRWCGPGRSSWSLLASAHGRRLRRSGRQWLERVTGASSCCRSDHLDVGPQGRTDVRVDGNRWAHPRRPALRHSADGRQATTFVHDYPKAAVLDLTVDRTRCDCDQAAPRHRDGARRLRPRGCSYRDRAASGSGRSGLRAPALRLSAFVAALSRPRRAGCWGARSCRVQDSCNRSGTARRCL
jgi:hypothetical protein